MEDLGVSNPMHSHAAMRLRTDSKSQGLSFDETCDLKRQSSASWQRVTGLDPVLDLCLCLCLLILQIWMHF